MQATGANKCIRRKAGFTLVETLLVVGILIALLALSVLMVSRYLGDIRQKEMDSKAEIIYTAAQNRLAVLRANGSEQKYQIGGGMQRIPNAPVGYDESISDTEYAQNPLFFVHSGNRADMGYAASEILPKGTVEYELWDNNWIIEYDPANGRVYAVFYSEERDLSDLFDDNKRNAFRYRQTRRSNGGYIGYYGGDVSLDELVSTLNPTISIENGEKLTATFQCASPDGQPLDFYITIYDGIREVKLNHTTQPGRIGKYVLVLDDLSSTDTQFKSLFPSLKPGSNITINLHVKSKSDMIDENDAPAKTTNSLFGDGSKPGSGTAEILCGRHLQNLDTSLSGVQGITHAIQKQHISFAQELGNDKNWYGVYGSKTFEPIENTALVSYVGSYENENKDLVSTTIRDLTTNATSGNSGLFAAFYGKELSGITLINATVTADPNASGTKSSNAGGLVGLVGGDTNISNCRVYWEPLDALDNKDKIWVSGENAGGLVGFLESGKQLTIEDSFAAMVVEGKSSAAGLVARANGSITIRRSYADCYLNGSAAAGLVISDGHTVLENCYAAGYISSDGDVAGLVKGSADMLNCYTAVVYSVSTDKVIFTTAKPEGSTAQNVYYLTVGGGSIENVTATAVKTFTEMSNIAWMAYALGEEFTDEVGGSASNPYKLQGQNLFAYSFPRLAKLPHYGDWEAEFTPGELVYYEQYAGNNQYGFEATGVGNLRTEGYVLGDDYGVAFDKSLAGGTAQILVSLNDGGQFALDTSKEIVIVHKGKTYYIYPINQEFLNAQKPASSKYYQKITITSDGTTKSFYFNPHFAKAFTAYQEGEEPKPTTTISIRSARQLHLLSLYYSEYAQITKNCTFQQEMDICYEGQVNQEEYYWKDYWGILNAEGGYDVSVQAPIGTEQVPFQAKYNGNYKKIYNLDIITDGRYVGLFGYVHKNATISNVLQVAYYNSNAGIGGEIRYKGGIESNEPVYWGTLAGRNDGRIINCAVSGYTSQLHIYDGSEVYQGGLVGGNFGSIYNSSVVGPDTTFNVDHSIAYAGGFAGVNYGTIGNSYAIGALRVEASKNSYTHLSGFVGQNNMGSIRDSYCATALIGSGDVSTSAFTPKGGLVGEVYYLANGAYYLADTLYAFESDEETTEGTFLTDYQLETLPLWDGLFERPDADHSYMHDNTSAEETMYQYPAIVRDAAGQVVHYGDWPVAVDLGQSGIFYWEKEEGGPNEGVHFSYIGITENHVATNGSNLCSAHEDGGRITAYGYGYFYRAPGVGQMPMLPVVTVEGIQDLDALAVDPDIAQELHDQMPQFNFVAFVTSNDSTSYAGELLKPVDGNANLTLTVDGEEFVISPFFADAMSYANWVPNAAKPSVYDLRQLPGTENNAYQIRSPQQLQFINWNHDQMNCTSYVSESNADWTDKYNYLRYYFLNGSNNTGTDYNYHWVQSHDVNFDYASEDTRSFTPIGSLYDRKVRTEGGSDGDVSEVTMAYFAGVYNGDDYTIRNLNISSSSECVGLFGVVMHAKLENIALYSDRGNVIQNNPDGFNWYCLGGLVGFAGAGTNSERSVITNCTVAGYTIIDRRSADGGWGGGNIGGLVGATNMDIDKCTAVTDIIVQYTYNSTYHNVRVGGLVGGCRSRVSDCYAGGSIQSLVSGDAGNVGGGSSVWIGGIVGGIVMRNKGNLSTMVGSVSNQVEVRNCYSYVSLPTPGPNRIQSVQSIASIGELTDGGFRDLDNASMQLVVYNSYCLKNTAENADDVNSLGSQTNWNETAANTLESYSSTRNAKIYNARSPYLSYEDMCDESKLKTYLGAAFGMITKEENGAPIPGKYTFPAGAEYLIGRNYPFPTILTQLDRYKLDAVGGETVNVHYGPWPIVGMYWYQYETGLDVFVHDENTAEAYPNDQKIVLILNEDVDTADMNLGPEDFLYDGEAFDAAKHAAQVIHVSAAEDIVGIKGLEGKKMVVVTLIPLKKGTVNITPDKGTKNYLTNELSVKVTAELRVEAKPVEVDQCRDDQTLVEFTATNKDGSKDMTALVDWEILLPQTDQTVAYIPEDGLVGNRVWIAAQDLGTTFLQATAVYDRDGLRAEAKTMVNVTTRNGVLGLSNNQVFNQAVVAGNGGEGVDRDDLAVQPFLSGAAVYLYADCDVSRFSIVSVKLNGVVLQKDAYTLSPCDSDGSYSYSELVLKSQVTGTANVEVVLKRADKQYTLKLENVELKPVYTVTFEDGNGNVIETLSVTEGSLLQYPAAEPVRSGYRFNGWSVPEGKPVTDNMTVTAEWVKVWTLRFEDGSGNVIETLSVIEGSLLQYPAAEPVRSGYRFDGWSVPEGTPVTSDMRVTAAWVKVWTLRFDANGGSFPAGTQTEFVLDAGESFTAFPADPANGSQKFGGWYLGDTKYTQITNISADMTLTAKWVSYNVIIYAPNGTKELIVEKDGSGYYVIENLRAYGYYNGRTVTVKINGVTVSQYNGGNRNWRIQNGNLTIYPRAYANATEPITIEITIS